MTRSTRARVGLAALAATVLALAGCGGSDDQEDAGPREAFVAEVDAICARTTAEIEARTEARLARVARPRGEDLKRVVREVTVPLLREQYEEVESLEPPPGDEEAIDAILAEAEETIDAVERDPVSALVPVGEPSPFDELNGLLSGYGMTECGGAEEPA